MKSRDEVKIRMLQNRIENERKKPFSQKFSAIAEDMNQKYATATKRESWEENELEASFKEYLSIVYDTYQDNRFIGLEIRDSVVVLSIDACSVIPNGRDIEFALCVFLEEWYPEITFNILLEWT